MRGWPVLLLLLVSTLAQAHTRSYSYSLWEMDASPPHLTVRLNQYDLTRLNLHPGFTADYARRVSELVTRQLKASGKDGDCRFVDTRIQQDQQGWVVLRANLQCDVADVLSISSTLLLDAISSHMHFVTVRDANGQVREKVLTEAEPGWNVYDSVAHNNRAGQQTFGRYWAYPQRMGSSGVRAWPDVAGDHAQAAGLADHRLYPRA